MSNITHFDFDSNNLQRFETETFELYINTQNGQPFANLKAIARMCNKALSTIASFEGVRKLPSVMVEIPTRGGIQGVRLFPDTSIVKFFSKYNPQLLEQFAVLGIREGLYRYVGYRHNENSGEVLQLETQNLELQLSLTESQRLLQESKELLEENQEKADFYDDFIIDDDDPDLHSFQDVANHFGLGRNTFIEMLRDFRVICKTSTNPFRKFIKDGYFVRGSIILNNSRTKKVTRLTNKGVTYCHKRLKKAGYIS